MGRVIELPGSPEPRRRQIVFVAGTRPEAIKLAPLLLAARGRTDLRCTLIGTGQHGELFLAALGAFGLVPDLMLGSPVPGLTIEALAERIDRDLPPLLDRLAADLVVVQGDTTSAWAGALAAHRHGTPIAHVEAGLRSGDPDLPWPEERNRTEIDRIATLLFAPSAAAADNLRIEGMSGRIHVTGNSGIDALLHVRARVAPAAADPAKRTVFVTCHRRENGGLALERICAAVRTLAARYDVAVVVALPGDPAKAQRLETLLRGAPNIVLEPPLDYPRAVARIDGAYLVLSDSGGLQEECAALGVPLLVLRDSSERPEVVASGNARLVGTDTATIIAAAHRLLDDAEAHAAMARPSFPYGEGDAALRMLDLIAAYPMPRG